MTRLIRNDSLKIVETVLFQQYWRYVLWSYTVSTTRHEKQVKYSVLVLVFGQKKPPGDYLINYIHALDEIKEETSCEKMHLYGIVDDVLPQFIFRRTVDEQQFISRQYVNHMKDIGFTDVYLSSDIMHNMPIIDLIESAKQVTIAEFFKMLPRHKRNQLEKQTMVQVLSFLWQAELLRNILTQKKLSGFITGIKSEFFYLMLRKLLPPHSTFFIERK